ncbi:hypothetical protein TanjilG_13830 [Lupinus angustifolius]|uniref:Pectinesterase inhibitor domain-containing protein n=1 Tax=Lupinus angustifolius TaxID=3871 RepID=A0A1J7HS69_LUPAN|nr:PREDICTED: pectinesterase inhibitor 1-like [Lupinus angustifolius]OIW15524.1 hypothetical protein TanjilG_13830 [Lupinus angustifolius]
MSYFSIKPSIISCFVLMFVLFAESSYAAKVVDVNDICKQSQNPSFCLTILNSKPGGVAGADLVTLAQYTIDIVRGNLTNSVTLIQSLIANSGNDATAKSHYEQCLTFFGDKEGALVDIDYTQELLKKGDYFGVNSAASAVIVDVDDCIFGEDPEQPPYPDKSDLPKNADFIDKVLEALLIISQLLYQK